MENSSSSGVPEEGGSSPSPAVAVIVPAPSSTPSDAPVQCPSIAPMAVLDSNENEANFETECIDLTEMDETESLEFEETADTGDDDRMSESSDVIYLSGDEDDVMSSSVYSSANGTFQLDWEKNSDLYPLYHANEDFRKSAKPFIDLLMKYGPECFETSWRANGRMPTVDEFWNYVFSKRVPRVGWIGVWKFVNTERRGWPLQYLAKTEILIKNISFTGLAAPHIDMELLERFDPRYRFKQKLDGVSLWQIEPVRAGKEFYSDGLSIEDTKEILELARTFYDTIFVPPDSDVENVNAYFGPVFYERLELLYYMENPAPYQGTLSTKDRGRIIAGLKQYHFLKNSLVDCSNLFLLIDGEEDEMIEGKRLVVDMLDDTEYSANIKQYVLLQMQLDRHKVELNFLMRSSLRALINEITPESTDSSFESYDHILVMKETNVGDLHAMTSQLQEHNLDASKNIRICSDLEMALKNCCHGATIFVASGNYCISGLHKLAYSGSLIGMKRHGENQNDVTVTPSEDVGDIWLLHTGSAQGEFVIKNINFVLDTDVVDTRLSCCLQVASGKLTIDNCNFRTMIDKKEFVFAKKSDSATVVATNCNFSFVEETEQNA